MYQAFALSTLADLPSCFACTYLCDRFGRKRIILLGLFTSGILLGFMTCVPRSMSQRYVVNMAIMITARFINGTAFSGMYTWTFELFPTVLRTQGMSVCVVLERLGMFFVPFITRILQRITFVLPFVIMSVLAVVATLVGLVLPETNNTPTRETYNDFFHTPTTPAVEMGANNECCHGDDTTNGKVDDAVV